MKYISLYIIVILFADSAPYSQNINKEMFSYARSAKYDSAKYLILNGADVNFIDSTYVTETSGGGAHNMPHISGGRGLGGLFAALAMVIVAPIIALGSALNGGPHSYSHYRVENLMEVTMAHYTSPARDSFIVFLVDHGAKINDANNTAVTLAYKDRNIKLFNLFLNHGGSIYNYKEYGKQQSLIYRACLDGRKEFVQTLIEHGADVNVTSPVDGMTPLYGAIRAHSTEIISLLLAHGASPVKTFYSGSQLTTPMIEAIYWHEKAVVQLFLDAGYSLNYIDSTYTTPLMAAVDQADTAMAIMLLEKGAKVFESIPSTGNTALHTVASVKNESREDVIIAELLAKKATAIDIQNRDGNTALILATKNGKVGIVKVLLFHSANPKMENLKHETALSVAETYHHLGLLKMLHSDENSQAYKVALLEKAVEINDTIKAKELLSAGIIPDYPMLSVAVIQNNESMVKLLISHGIKPDQLLDEYNGKFATQFHYNTNALLSIYKSNNNSMINLLVEAGLNKTEADKIRAGVRR